MPRKIKHLHEKAPKGTGMPHVNGTDFPEGIRLQNFARVVQETVG